MINKTITDSHYLKYSKFTNTIPYKMIPKIIHYCWFGGKTKPRLVKKCIKTWRIYLPEYEFKEWNEQNFDINCNLYVKEAYETKRYAFVSDYVRLYALYNEGGIYLDTDAEVLCNFDDLLGHSAFTGFEDENYIQTAIIGSEKKGQWIYNILSLYENAKFILQDGSIDLTPNTHIITKYMESIGIKRDNSYQEIDNYVTIYPMEYFCPKSWIDKKTRVTMNSKIIHHFNGSWKPENFYSLFGKIKFAAFPFFQKILKITRTENLYLKIRNTYHKL